MGALYDVLLDPLRSDPPVDEEIRFHLYHLEVERYDLVQFSAERYLRWSPTALKRLDQMISSGLGPLNDPEIRRLRRGLESIVPALQRLAGQSVPADADRVDAVRDLIDESVVELAKDKRRYLQARSDLRQSLSAEAVQTFDEGLELLSEGVAETSSSRTPIVRKARTLFEDAVTRSSSNPITSIYLSWCRWMSHEEIDSIVESFATTAIRASGTNPIIESICWRQYACVATRAGMPARATEAIGKALAVRDDPPTRIQAAILKSLGDGTGISEFAEHALRLSPLDIISVLALSAGGPANDEE